MTSDHKPEESLHRPESVPPIQTCRPPCRLNQGKSIVTTRRSPRLHQRINGTHSRTLSKLTGRPRPQGQKGHISWILVTRLYNVGRMRVGLANLAQPAANN